jgi:hypothetical protein
VYAFFIAALRATCSVHLILLDFITNNIRWGPQIMAVPLPNFLYASINELPHSLTKIQWITSKIMQKLLRSYSFSAEALATTYLDVLLPKYSHVHWKQWHLFNNHSDFASLWFMQGYYK